MEPAIYTMGADIGSTTSKCVIMRNASEIVASAVFQGGAGTGGPDRAVKSVLDSAGISLDNITNVIATGYGRNTFREAQKTFSELSCHAIGALFLCPDVRMVIDIGGQDCKAMQLTDDGKLDVFAMNDKCAAGTGRFLEVMSRVLETDISDMGNLSSESENISENIIDITSTCTVFAESEVISQLSKGADKKGLILGIHRSVAVKAAGIAKRLGVLEPVFFSGGVSMNKGVAVALSHELGVEVKTDPRAQLAGAIGAALHI